MEYAYVLVSIFVALILVVLLGHRLVETVIEEAEQARLEKLRLVYQERKLEEATWKAWADAVEQDSHAFKGPSKWSN